jgi:hypothetical protein
VLVRCCCINHLQQCHLSRKDTLPYTPASSRASSPCRQAWTQHVAVIACCLSQQHYVMQSIGEVVLCPEC